MHVESLLKPLVEVNSESNNLIVLNSDHLNEAPRPGRQSKHILKRSPVEFGKPGHRIEHSYSCEFKIMVLGCWLHHQIEQSSGSLRAPLLKEVAARDLVPISTLHAWRVNQDQIILSKKGTRKCSTPAHRCQWPEL